jgi:hypothetical protein
MVFAFVPSFLLRLSVRQHPVKKKRERKRKRERESKTGNRVLFLFAGRSNAGIEIEKSSAVISLVSSRNPSFIVMMNGL